MCANSHSDFQFVVTVPVVATMTLPVVAPVPPVKVIVCIETAVPIGLKVAPLLPVIATPCGAGERIVSTVPVAQLTAVPAEQINHPLVAQSVPPEQSVGGVTLLDGHTTILTLRLIDSLRAMFMSFASINLVLVRRFWLIMLLNEGAAMAAMIATIPITTISSNNVKPRSLLA